MPKTKKNSLANNPAEEVNNLAKKLSELKRSDLRILAEKLKLENYKSLNKAPLIKYILEKRSEKEIKAVLSKKRLPKYLIHFSNFKNWCKKRFNYISGSASILGLIVSLWFIQSPSCGSKANENEPDATAAKKENVMPMKPEPGNPDYLEYYETLKEKLKKIHDDDDDGNRKEEARILAELGNYYKSHNDFNEAKTHHEQLLKINRDNKDYLEEGITLLNLGEVSAALKDYDNATSNFERSIEIFSNLKLMNREAVGRVNLAHIYSKLGNVDGAVSELESAAKIYDKIRFENIDNSLKSPFFKSNLEVYKLLFKLHFEKKGDVKFERESKEKAFNIAEKSKDVVFAEMIARKGEREKIAKHNDDFQELLNRETLYLERIRQTKKMMKDKISRGNPFSDKLEDDYSELNLLQKEMENSFPSYFELLYPKKMGIRGVQSLLKDDETYISLYLLEHYSVAFVINRRNWEAVRLHIGQNKIEEKIVGLREFIRRTSDVVEYPNDEDHRRRFSDYNIKAEEFKAASMELYKELFNPLLPYCKTKKVVVSADGVLYGFPLEALITKIPEYYKDAKGNRYKLDEMLTRIYLKRIPLFYEYSQVEYLADKFIISYIPSGSCFNFLRKKSKPKVSKRNSVIVFANPQYSNNPLEKDEEKKKRNLYIENRSLKEWPHKDLEESFDTAVAFTREIGNARFYAGCEAKEEMYSSSNIKDAKYILFSTWCVLGRKAEQTDRTEPALILTQVDNPEEYDGLLGMTEVAGIKLKCDIVIFSASNSTCETETGGEGFAGMTKSFLFSGSQAVVASHWQVDPSIAKKWLEIFGENLKTKAKLTALHETKKRIKESIEYEGNDGVKVSYAHPYYWAPFVLFGENEYEKED